MVLLLPTKCLALIDFLTIGISKLRNSISVCLPNAQTINPGLLHSELDGETILPLGWIWTGRYLEVLLTNV